DAEDQHFGAADGFADVVEGILDPAHDVGGHGDVDLAGELDKTRRHTVLARLPGEVKGVDRYAVPAEPRAGVETLEAEGLGGGGVEHFPDVDAHALVDQLELVDQRDVDRAVDVFG